ncbi:MAG: asparagine synthase (glutamine-hydrolyzing) [Candidatus Marinimicrobia bacterium]|nr:asparagine synthase (glutamine-hydrolyzing) [Candidatus Neomarinimicrobiota bacterium]
MCGVCGIYEKDVNNEALMKNMLDIIAHRGPDLASVYQNHSFCLGHRRLSIVDLETGDQPIFNEDKSLCVVFNGEIYNFEVIKRELQQKGHQFRTKSDTEILVHAYEEWNTSFFSRLNGIFAFALLDIRKEKLFLARDPFGVKPMHYYFQNGILVFGSEQKSILLHPGVDRQINYKALHSQINLRYTQGDETLFADIKRLPPAHYLVLENNQISIKRYWSLKPEINPEMKEDEAIEKLHFHLKTAVQRQLMSDVPLGVYLSGGMDSSTIVQKMSELGVPEINTFTLGFNEPTDEFPDADRISKYFNTNHHTLSLSMNPMQQFPQVLWHAEEPKINLLQGFNMSKFVSKDIRVVLGGLGGDELFAGYDIHKFIYPFNRINDSVPGWMKKLLDFKAGFLFKLQNSTKTLRFDEYRRGLQMLLAIGQIEKFYLILRNVWDFDNGFYRDIYHPLFYKKMLNEVSKIRNEFVPFFEQSKNFNMLDRVLLTEFQSKMVNDYLLVEDRMSMANSIEERVPFLDIDLVNFGFSIPVDLKIKNNQTKYLFRKAMKDLLPPKIVTKKKWGFTVNPYLQFKKDLGAIAKRVLTKEFVDRQGIFNHDYIARIIHYPASPKLRWHYNFLWIVLGIAIWEEMFIKSNKFIERKFNLEDYIET